VKFPRPRVPRISFSWRRITAGKALPWVLFLVAAAVAMFNWYQWRGLKADNHEREVVASVGHDFVLALTSFSGTTIDADVRRIKSFAVGDFAQQVDQTFSDAQIQRIKSAHVVSKSKIAKLFVEDVTGAQATVFAVVDETVTNRSSPASRTDVLRLEVGLIDTTDGWKVNNVNILQTPGTGTGLPGG